MHSYVFTSRYFRLVLLLALIAAVTSILSPTSQVRADQGYIVYLPIIRRSSAQPPPPIGSPEQQALDRLNYYRSLAGSSPLQLHPALVTSAQNHANYFLLNRGDPSAWDSGGYHSEVAGKPAYTGRRAGERATAAGYPWSAGWEVMSFRDDPVQSVDLLIATVFHRVGMLDPYLQYIGYGHGHSSAWAVDVMDFGHGTIDSDRKQVILYPAAEQVNVPLEWWGTETPNPLPPNATYPVGYPITIQPINSVLLTVTLAELRDSNGALVSVHPNPSNCGTTCYALIPVNPLQKTTTYTVHVVGTVDGDAFDKTWTFTTTAD